MFSVLPTVRLKVFERKCRYYVSFSFSICSYLFLLKFAQPINAVDTGGGVHATGANLAGTQTTGNYRKVFSAKFAVHRVFFFLVRLGVAFALASVLFILAPSERSK